MGKESNIFVALLFPTLTMLSACGNINKFTVKEEFKINEDTYANDELFDNAKMINDYIPDNSEIPAIGIQRSEPDANNKVSIRYIAAIKVVDLNNDQLINEADVSLTTATWYRGFYDNTNGESLLSDEAKPSNKAYIAFNNGGTRYSIDDYNNDHNTSYNYFVTYVLTGVSLTKYATSYLNAYVVVNNEIYSNSVTTSVDANTQFSFDANKTGYFVLKKTATGFETVDPIKYENFYEDNCLARVEFNRKSTDTFIGLYRNGNDMKIFDFPKMNNRTGNGYALKKDKNSQFATSNNSSIKHIVMFNGNDITDAQMNFYFYDCEVVKYGLYPQDTYITDADLISELNSLTAETNQRVKIDDKYYISTEVNKKYSSSKLTDNTTIGDLPDKVWFKMDPIEWRTFKVSNGISRMVAYRLLDVTPYSIDNVNGYDVSTLRAFLNPGGYFYENAFFLKDDDIKSTLVDNSLASTKDTENPYVCDDTNDNVYVLSNSEIESTDYGFGNKDLRVCITTNWARVRGAYLVGSTSGASAYWTRSPDNVNENYACYIDSKGNRASLDVTLGEYCVRPAITVDTIA